MASINADNVAGSGDDTEEMYLYLDFNTIPLSDELNEPELKFKIVGLESENPVIQINNKFFKGEYQDTIGTNLFFEQQEGNQAEFDSVFRKNPEKKYKYMAKTNKSLVMKRIFLESREKDDNRTEEASTSSAENSSKFQVTKTYQETLCQLVKPGRSPPHVLSDCLDDKIRSTQEVAEEYHDLDMQEDRKPLH